MKNTFRTTKKEFKEQVQNYIINCLSDDRSEELTEQLQDTVKSFNNWYGEYERRRTPNIQKAFIDWLKCLPSELSVDFVYYNISKQMESWFVNCGQPYVEKEGYDEQFYYFIYREFQSLCKKHDIQVRLGAI